MNSGHFWAAALVPLLASCNPTLLQPPRLTSNPGSYNQVLQPEEEIFVHFPFQPERLSAEMALEISDAGGEVAGRLEWLDDRQLLFHPQSQLVAGRRYLLSIRALIGGEHHRQHQIDHVVPFFYRYDTSQALYIDRASPDAGSTIVRDSQLQLRFSQPVAAETIDYGLSISPEIEYQIYWNNHHTDLDITAEWQPHTLYHLQLNDDIASNMAVPLDRNYSFYYWCEETGEPPQLIELTAIDGTLPISQMSQTDGHNLLATNYQLLHHDALRFIFSEDMQTRVTEESVTLQPSLAGQFLWPSERIMIFRPDEGFDQQSDYLLTLSDEARDHHNRALDNPLSRTLGTTIAPLQLQAIHIAPEDDSTITNYSTIAAVDLTAQNPLVHDYTLTFEFDGDFPSAAQKQATQNAIEMRRLFANGLIAPQKRSFNWIGNNTISITYYNMVPSTATVDNYILLVISGGAQGPKTANGRYLPTDIRQLFRMR